MRPGYDPAFPINACARNRRLRDDVSHNNTLGGHLPLISRLTQQTWLISYPADFGFAEIVMSYPADCVDQSHGTAVTEGLRA